MKPLGSGISRVIQRHLATASANQSKAFERVSSGKRINRAADDAAGLAVAESLDTAARSKRAAIRNIQDGLNMLDVAEGGLASIGDMLSRLRELAIQSASETLSDSERKYVQGEYAQLLREISVTARRTDWNGKSLLNTESVDVGIIVDSTDDMSTAEMPNVKAAIQKFHDALSKGTVDVAMGLAEMNDNVDPTDGVARLSDIGDDDFETQLTNLTVSTGLTDPYSALMNTSGAADLAGTVEPDKFSWRKDSKRRIMVMVTDSWRETDLIPGSETKADVASALATHGVEVHTINHPIADPFYDTITSATGGSTSNLGGLFATNVEASFHAIADSILDEFGTPTLSVQASDGAGPESRIDLRLPFNATAFGLRLADSNVATRENAMEAIEKIDRAINNTNKMRAKVGGYTNRLTSALNLETTSLENAELSRSRIEDADLAFETAQMAKAQILSTAATNLLTVASRIEREMVSKLLG